MYILVGYFIYIYVPVMPKIFKIIKILLTVFWDSTSCR